MISSFHRLKRIAWTVAGLDHRPILTIKKLTEKCVWNFILLHAWIWDSFAVDIIWNKQCVETHFHTMKFKSIWVTLMFTAKHVFGHKFLNWHNVSGNVLFRLDNSCLNYFCIHVVRNSLELTGADLVHWTTYPNKFLHVSTWREPIGAYLYLDPSFVYGFV